jgi:hypothetical protein
VQPYLHNRDPWQEANPWGEDLCLLEEAGVVARANVSERTALAALSNLRRRGMVEAIELGGKSNPKAYRLSGAGASCRVVPVAQAGENALLEETELVQRGLHKLKEDDRETLRNDVYLVQSDGEGTSQDEDPGKAAEEGKGGALWPRKKGGVNSRNSRNSRGCRSRRHFLLRRLRGYCGYWRRGGGTIAAIGSAVLEGLCGVCGVCGYCPAAPSESQEPV